MPPNPCKGTPRKQAQHSQRQHREQQEQKQEPWLLLCSQAAPEQRQRQQWRRRSHSTTTIYTRTQRGRGEREEEEVEEGHCWIYVREASVLGERPAWHDYDMAIFLGKLQGTTLSLASEREQRQRGCCVLPSWPGCTLFYCFNKYKMRCVLPLPLSLYASSLSLPFPHSFYL